MNEKQAYYLLALKDILELFAEQELGTDCEIDIPKAIEYLSSFKFAVDTMNYNNKDEIYQAITDDILNGYPIWQLLKISDWKKNMLEREFANEKAKAQEELIKKYKCFTCEYFVQQETSIGLYLKCKYESTKNSWKLKRESAFTPKKACSTYKPI